jgi:hypothetical protein
MPIVERPEVMSGDCSAITVKSRVRRIILAALLVLGLSACGVGFVYNRLDWVMHVYISNQVSLDKLQSQQLRGNLREFLVWHRQSELPRYAAFLDQFATDAQQPVGVQRINDARLTIESFVNDAVARAVPDAARWLAVLRAEQLDELFVSLAEDDEDLREKYCDADLKARRKRRDRNFIEAVEDWTGRLDRAQRDLIHTRFNEMSGDSCAFVDNQVLARRALRALIDQHRADPDFAAQLNRFVARPEERWSAQYRADFESNRTRIIQLLAELDRTLSAQQRTRCSTRLRDLAKDMRELALARR